MIGENEARRPRVTVFAPATIANVGPGFDVLALAVEGLGDTVTAGTVSRGRVLARDGAQGSDRAVWLRKIEGSTELTPSADNTACVAARVVLDLLRARREVDEDFGVELVLKKGLPIGSGLGSSGASAAAAAVAVNALCGAPLATAELLPACAEGERAACGAAHRDNVAAALFGGVVLVRGDGSVTRIETPLALQLALVRPQRALPTREARAAIPAAVPLGEAVHNSAQLATMVYALARGDLALLAGALDDRIAEPRRAPLIPGFDEVKAAALSAGALGASIAGAGPTIFALCADRAGAEAAARAMSDVLEARGQTHDRWIRAVDQRGARPLEDR